jgi:dTDP-glucose 4,6-dehydratase
LHSNEKLPVNIGNPREMTILQFGEAVQKATGSKVPIDFRSLPVDDPKVRRPDISKAQRVLGGWAPAISLEEGLARTTAYFKKKLAKG